MKRNRSCAHSAARVVVAAVLVVFLADVSAAIELSILETGPEPDADVGLWIRDWDWRRTFSSPLVSLTSPTGDVFTSGTVLEARSVVDLLIRFDSLTEASDYVDGTWQATVTSRYQLPWEEPTFGDFEFTIDGTALTTVNRTVPTLVSPPPGAVIKNGSAFPLGWDYVTSGEVPDRTIIQIVPQFDPISSLHRHVVSTPDPGGTTSSSGSTGTGDVRFSETLKNVPGTNENRFLMSLTAASAALPLDVEMTLGTYSPLDDAVVISYASSLVSEFGTPYVNLVYSREHEPFYITLSTASEPWVPEPSSLALVVAMVIGSGVLRSRPAARRLVRGELFPDRTP